MSLLQNQLEAIDTFIEAQKAGIERELQRQNKGLSPAADRISKELCIRAQGKIDGLMIARTILLS